MGALRPADGLPGQGMPPLTQALSLRAALPACGGERTSARPSRHGRHPRCRCTARHRAPGFGAFVPAGKASPFPWVPVHAQGSSVGQGLAAAGPGCTSQARTQDSPRRPASVQLGRALEPVPCFRPRPHCRAWQASGAGHASGKTAASARWTGACKIVCFTQEYQRRLFARQGFSLVQLSSVMRKACGFPNLAPRPQRGSV